MNNGWQTRRIGEVCDLATGGTPSTTNSAYYGGDIRWLVSGDIHKREIFDCEGRITEAGVKASNAKLLPINSVMIALNGQGKTRGTVALLRTLATCNQSMVSITPKASSGLLSEFLFANLHGRYEEIRRLTSDADNDRRGLNMGMIREIKVPIAPIAEQRRIVALLDEAFEAIATARDNAARNLQNGGEAFEATLNSTFSHATGEGTKTTLGAVCKFIGGSQPPKSEFIYDARTGYVRLIQIRDYKSDKNIVYIPKCLARRFCTNDDVMIGRYGPPLFQILRGLDGAYNVALMKAAPNEEVLSKDYLYFFLRNRDILNYIIAASARAAGQIGLTKETIEPYPIFLPNMDMQIEIVKRISEMEIATDSLKELYRAKLTALDELKKSILHQAFTGQLTTNKAEDMVEAVA